MTPKLKLPTCAPGHSRFACEPWGQLDRPQAELSSDRCDLVLARRSRRHREAIAQPSAGIEQHVRANEFRELHADQGLWAVRVHCASCRTEFLYSFCACPLSSLTA